MTEAQTRLVRALIARSGGAARMVRAETRAWASVTFTGARHCLSFVAPAAAADRLGDGIDEHEFAIPGHIVADIAVTARHAEGDEVTIEIEALTIEEA